MILVYDSESKDINRRLSAKNFFNGTITSTLRKYYEVIEHEIFFITDTIDGIIHADSVLPPKNEIEIEDTNDEDISSILKSLLTLQIMENLDENEVLILIADNQWYVDNQDMVKTIIDVLGDGGHVFLVGYGEELTEDRIKISLGIYDDSYFNVDSGDYISSLKTKYNDI